MVSCKWPVLIEICGALGEMPEKESIAPLVARWKKEKGRMRLDIVFAINSIIGQKIEIIFGPQALVGSGIRAKADQMGVDLGNDEWEAVRNGLKEGIAAKGGLTEAEMEDLIRQAAGKTA